jgi:hypothetical protein
MITSCLFLAAFCEAEFPNETAASDTIIRDETEYGSFWAFGRRLLGYLFRSIVGALIYLLIRRWFQRVSCRRNEMKQVLLQNHRIIMEQLRNASEFTQDIQEYRERFWNKAELLGRLAEEECERLNRFQNEIDSMNEMMKAREERQDQFQDQIMQMNTMMKMEGKRHDQLQEQIDSLKATMKAAHKLPDVPPE